MGYDLVLIKPGFCGNNPYMLTMGVRQMARVFQIIATDAEHEHFEPQILDSGWHSGIVHDDFRTVCGIQMAGEDGYCAGDEVEGRVTCPICRLIIGQIKKIRSW